MLQSAVMNALFSQHMTHSQSSSQIVSDEEEFKINKILRKKLIWQREEFKKKYLIKWVNYTWSTWELTSVLQNTVTMNQLLWKQQEWFMRESKEGLHWKLCHIERHES